MALTKRQQDQKKELERQLTALLRKKYDPKDDKRIADLRDYLKKYE